MAQTDRFLVVLRYPFFRFRPSQADLLHLDLWIDGDNILRDAGSFSYLCDTHTEARFLSAQGHNTVEFDGRDPMPRLSKFLYADWPSSKPKDPQWQLEAGISSISVGYEDYQGASHVRQVKLNGTGLTIIDSLAGFTSRAVLRWRLQPGEYELNVANDKKDISCMGKWGSLRIESESDVGRCELLRGLESRYYGTYSELPVIELEVLRPGEIRTVISLAN